MRPSPPEARTAVSQLVARATAILMVLSGTSFGGGALRRRGSLRLPVLLWLSLLMSGFADSRNFLAFGVTELSSGPIDAW